jgi:hypothetical protein
MWTLSKSCLVSIFFLVVNWFLGVLLLACSVDLCPWDVCFYIGILFELTLYNFLLTISSFVNRGFNYILILNPQLCFNIVAVLNDVLGAWIYNVFTESNFNLAWFPSAHSLHIVRLCYFSRVGIVVSVINISRSFGCIDTFHDPFGLMILVNLLQFALLSGLKLVFGGLAGCLPTCQ